MKLEYHSGLSPHQQHLKAIFDPLYQKRKEQKEKERKGKNKDPQYQKRKEQKKRKEKERTKKRKEPTQSKSKEPTAVAEAEDAHTLRPSAAEDSRRRQRLHSDPRYCLSLSLSTPIRGAFYLIVFFFFFLFNF